MFASPYFRSALACSKRVKITAGRIRQLSSAPSDSQDASKAATENAAQPHQSITRSVTEPTSNTEPDGVENQKPKEWKQRLETYESEFRLPRNVQAIYHRPLKREPKYGLPVCDLQLRSYSSRHVEFFADFALRAAYYLDLPASGPVPLPRIVERWTVIKSPFIFKKSQENFERITLRRLVQVKDGHIDVVQAWLAFLRKHAFHGVGMKANVFEHASIGVGKSMDDAAKSIEKELDAQLGNFGAREGVENQEDISDIIDREWNTRDHLPMTDVRKQ